MMIRNIDAIALALIVAAVLALSSAERAGKQWAENSTFHFQSARDWGSRPAVLKVLSAFSK